LLGARIVMLAVRGEEVSREVKEVVERVREAKMEMEGVERRTSERVREEEGLLLEAEEDISGD